MDSLHTVLRSIREHKAPRDHLDVFRAFLDHLDRIGRSAGLRNVTAPSVGARHASPLQPTVRRKAK